MMYPSIWYVLVGNKLAIENARKSLPAGYGQGRQATKFLLEATSVGPDEGVQRGSGGM
jgi:hypothetical protein